MKKMTYAVAITGLTCALVASGGMAAATEPTEPVVVYEVGFFLYKKLNPSLPASWDNSGPQNLVTYAPGTEWFIAFPGELPDDVCGPGWAVQQDLIGHDGSFVWPETITYPDNILSKAGVLVDAIHADLETLVAVPDCVIEPTPEPTRTVGPMPLPPLEPPTVERLPETGLEGWFWVLLAVGLGLFAAGWVAVRSSHDSERSTN